MTEESRPTLINAWSRSASRAPSEPVRHKLIDVLVIAVCATICGAEAWTEMEEFGKAKEEWLRTFLELPNGIPSHDTFRRVFMRIKPSEFQRSFLLLEFYQLSSEKQPGFEKLGGCLSHPIPLST